MSMEKFTMAAPCLFGLEGLVGDELRRMNMENVKVEDRRVFFEGDFEALARANVRLRMAERVMILLARFPAMSFEELYQGVKAIPLERFIPKDGAFPVKGYSLDSQLHSVPDCQAICKKAAVDRLGAKYGLSWLPETGATYQLRFSIMKNICEVFLDTSGVSLHKRGYRAVGNEAPLHETMAAALVNLSRYRGREYFWDPFCGSGTIVIEAAMAALNRAPGLNRDFGAMKWDCVPREVWQQVKAEAKDLEYRGEYRILGTDIDSRNLSIAIANAKKAGVSKYIEFKEADATKQSLPCDTGLLVCNPPYGERMLEQRAAQQLVRSFGRHLRFADGWKKYIISSEAEFEHYFGKQATKKRKLYNGRLQCNVYMYF
ncbi:MAG: class I SAM-dependent RNA methyltransferase [Oscillospiraceae bacterium]|nr:class I SAM-dependent RNA methyltransferase [Oscillospiraceae bacterium]